MLSVQRSAVCWITNNDQKPSFQESSFCESIDSAQSGQFHVNFTNDEMKVSEKQEELMYIINSQFTSLIR